MAKRSFETEIQINASANRVWSIISDWESYPDWNPFVKFINGRKQLGARVRVKVQPAKGPAFTFRPYIKSLEPRKELSWLGRYFFAQIFSGEHYMRIEPLGEGEGVRFVHGESFGGVLVPLLWKGLNTNTKAGFEAMNEALKERAEA